MSADESLRRRRQLFVAVTLTAFGLLWQPHPFINDELPQALGLDALHHGRLVVQEPFPSDFLELQSEGWDHWAVPQDGQKMPPIGSTPLNLVALPLFELLQLVAQVIGAGPTLTLVVATITSGTFLLGLQTWNRSRSWPLRWKLLAVAALFTMIMAGVATDRQSSFPTADFTLELGAIQLVSMACAALGGLAVHDSLRERFPNQAWALAWAYTFATPVAFWAAQAKYHSAAILLVVAIAWALIRVGGPRRFLLAGLFAGLACWNQLPLGGIAALALGVTAVLTSGSFLIRLRRSAEAVLGGVAGLAGMVIEWLLLRSQGISSQYISAANPGESTTQYALANVSWTTWHVFREAVIWTNGHDLRGGLAFASLAPFLVLGGASFARRFQPALSTSLVIFSASYVLLLFAILGPYLLDIGFAFENRHVTTLLPLLFLLGAPALAHALEGAPPNWHRWVAVSAIFLFTLNPILNYAGHQFAYAFSGENRLYDAVWLWRTLGTVASVACAGWVLWNWCRPLTDSSREAGAAFMIIGLALGLSVQFWLLLERDMFYSPPDEPFRFWLVEELNQLVDRITFDIVSREATTPPMNWG